MHLAAIPIKYQEIQALNRKNDGEEIEPPWRKTQQLGASQKLMLQDCLCIGSSTWCYCQNIGNELLGLWREICCDLFHQPMLAWSLTRVPLIILHSLSLHKYKMFLRQFHNNFRNLNTESIHRDVTNMWWAFWDVKTQQSSKKDNKYLS